jgi:hypothetical protein
MGAPGADMQISDADKTLIYHWNEKQGWLKQDNTVLTPFVGYAFTQNLDHEAKFEITATPIVPEPDQVQVISLTVTEKGMGGSNVFVNSFLAPIDLTTFDDSDFEGEVDKTFYLFNSGSWKQWQEEGGAENQMQYGVSPGQYYALSPLGAGLMDPQYDQTTIPPMQGVYVVAKDNAKIKLNYEKHVYSLESNNTAMRAPQKHEDDFRRVRLQVSGRNSGADRMYVIQYNEGTASYDNGYDAKNIMVDGQVNIYTHEAEGQMEISVSDKIDSTYIGFRAGSDSEYTIGITSVVGEQLYLKDLVEDKVVVLKDGEQYHFSAQPNSVNDTRFLLLDKQRSGSIEQDADEIEVYVSEETAYVKQAPVGSQIYIYTTSGVVVDGYSINCTPCTIDLSGLPAGIYVLRMNDKACKFICK